MVPSRVPSPPWIPYFRACLTSIQAVDAVERVLDALPPTTWTAADDIRRRTGHGISLDHVLEILSALASIGVGELDKGHRWLPTASTLPESVQQRALVRQAVEWTAGSLNAGQPSLLVSTPTDATTPAFRHQFGDLRTTLRSIIAGSQRDLILAAPFWDLEVATDLSTLLVRRLEAGVRIRIIARAPQPGSPSDRAISLIGRIEAGNARCDIRILDKSSARDRFGRETFHFKMVGADRSAAYIGSANFDTAGLASRWELGVLLRADSAREVFDLVNALADGAPPREVS